MAVGVGSRAECSQRSGRERMEWLTLSTGCPRSQGDVTKVRMSPMTLTSQNPQTGKEVVQNRNGPWKP